MNRGSSALRALQQELEAHPSEVITRYELLTMVRNAAQWTEDMEHDDYMGEYQ